MPANTFELIHHHVVENLLSGLSNRLTYHSIEHTFDVLDQVQRIAREEGINDEEQLFLLKTAALYHDTGFLSKYVGHEEVGCQLAKKELPGFGLTPEQIEKICGLIMATRVPQRPNNRLEEIICDADLDYLGQNEFEPISESLRKEFLEYGIVHSDNEWYTRQLDFLMSHKYFTESSRKCRGPLKNWYLEKLRSEQ